MSNRDAAELHREIEQLRAELNHIATCSRNRDEENAQLRSELDAARKWINADSVRIGQLSADLARVTAERDEARADLGKFLTADAKNAASHAALRARVAELEEKAERYRLTTLSQDATIAELTTDGNAATLAANLAAVSKRNAELVAALEKIAKADPLENGRYAAFRASAALARAESAESKSHPNPSEIRMSESATPAKNAADTPKNREACAKIMAAWAAEDTPAKHPDAEIVDWMESTEFQLYRNGGKVVLMRLPHDEGTSLPVHKTLRAAIDAARKQGGAA